MQSTTLHSDLLECCMYVIQMYGNIYFCMYVCEYICMYMCVCMYVCMCVCMHICAYVCMYLFIYLLRIPISCVCAKTEQQCNKSQW